MHVARELICREDHKTRNMVVSSSTSGGGGFCYSDLSHNSNNPTIQTQPLLVSQIPNYDSNSEIFNLSQGMEMIGFPKNMQQSQNDASNSLFWKGNNFFGKPVNQHDGDGEDDHNSNSEHGPSSSKAATVTAATLNGDAVSDFYHHQGFNKSDFSSADQNLMAVTTTASHVDSSPWQENKLMVDDASIRCVFPCEGNERPSQGLSLSLSSADPSSIGLQSFELRQTTHHSHSQQGDMRLFASASASSSREGFYGKPLGSNIHQHQQPMMTQHQQGLFQLRSSKYLGPAQELLNEFCSLGTKQHDLPKPKPNKSTNMEEENNSNNNGISGSSKQQSLGSLEFMELQKRKTKLLSMLDEVDRRYRHYCDQMKAVVSSFEAVAGNGAATVYSALASKAMSRHFRCLRDGIVGQIQATKKALGEKDLASPGTTRGETPRLKIIDQALRQQRAFQQMSMMENHPWRPQRGLPERSVSVLRAWLFEHFLHPYPSDVDKHILARQTGLSRSQVSNWFINARVRLWKPMVEEMYLEETKEQDNLGSSDGAADLDDIGRSSNQSSQARVEDQKPTSDQLVRIDSECLSSIITSPEKIDHLSKMTSSSRATPQTHHLSMNHQSTSFGRIGGNSYSGMEIDFSSYNHHPAGAVPYSSSIDTNQNNFSGGIGGGGVSLTLGLQQHGGNHGVSLAFSPATQGSLFYPRDHIEDCHPSVQYSLLDGDQGQNLPYRNLMGAQLLHDLAG